MKYVILIHSNPQPWGHPTPDYLPEHQALPAEEREAGNRAFDEGFAEVIDRGELVHAEALASPTASRLFRWKGDQKIVVDGPYAEGREHLAGFFLVDTETQERAEEIAALFGARGETVELRPVMSEGPDES
ncbi:hypothetical protein CFK41_00125 [Brachybacterium ginsengisoli]|uniref:YCII-related domain-containing protein n=1 Tax=Brachybacterium ginsengisoli TaxID=1331682 RepID=A0A291GT07_9MICO|nr:YciI family protein [Brachybacterium ginsengisoli]ATG53357.1 hypothetical protein CFK41_00125 [Brachybacterium ginsengisoli]